jgi:hypothetical protein
MEDYKNAAIRHYRDAVTLRATNRNDNAGHLLGFAAECAIKSVLVGIGKSPTKMHLPTLVSEALLKFAARHPLYAPLTRQPFQNWKIAQRYETDGHVSQAQLNDWFECTRAIFVAANIKVRI